MLHMIRQPSHTAQELEEVLYHSEWIMKISEETFRDVKLFGNCVDINAESFLELHPSLLVAINGYFDYVARPGAQADDCVNGKNILQTVKLLREGTVKLRSVTGRSYDVLDFHKIGICCNTGERVRVVCSTATINYKIYGGLRVPYIVHTHSSQVFEMHRSELDATFPGWFERYNVAMNLDFSDSEVATYVFRKMPAIVKDISVE